MGRLAVSVFMPSVGPGEAVSPGGRVRVLLGAALFPVVLGYAATASVLAVVAVLAPWSDVSFPGIVAAACPAWLAVYQVPLDIAGSPLGVLPLLPTVAAGVLVSRTAATAVRRLDDTGPAAVVPIVAVIAGAHALTSVGMVLVTAGFPVTGSVPEALVAPPVLAGALALLGACTADASPGWSQRVDPVAMRGVRAGLWGFAGLIGVGMLTVVVATAASGSRFGELLTAYAPDPGSAVGMLLLSLAYLPNAAVLAGSVITGSGFSLGAVSVSAFSYTPGPVPALPVLAGLPEQYGAWWPMLLLVAGAVGAGVGWSLRDVDEGVGARLRSVLVAAVLCGFCSVIVGACAGGALGGGQYGPVAVDAEVFSLLTFGWIAVPGGLVVWLGGPRPPRAESRRTPRRHG